MLFGKDLMMTWMVGFHKGGSPVSENIYTLFATTFHNTLTSPKIIKVSLLRQNGFILTVTSHNLPLLSVECFNEAKVVANLKDGCHND